VPVPAGVTAQIVDGVFVAKGSWRAQPAASRPGRCRDRGRRRPVKPVNDSKQSRMMWGTTRNPRAT